MLRESATKRSPNALGNDIEALAGSKLGLAASKNIRFAQFASVHVLDVFAQTFPSPSCNLSKTMLALTLGQDRKCLRVLCLGAHSDDIEIGCAGTLLRWIEEYQHIEITWAVLSATSERGEEARLSANALLRAASTLEIVVGDFEDGHFPAEFTRVKSFLTNLRKLYDVDVVLTHGLNDRHQDHKLIAEMTWQTWRNHFILEYEIPKYEGDLGTPNFFVPFLKSIADRKVGHLLKHFGTQRSKDWFSADSFLGLMRLRGLECRSASGFAEGFFVRKMIV